MTLVWTVIRKARWPSSSNHRDSSPHNKPTSSRIGIIEQIGLNPKARIDIHLLILPRQTNYINPRHLLCPMKCKRIRFRLWWQRASRSIISLLSGRRRRKLQILSRLTIALWSPKLLRSVQSKKEPTPSKIMNKDKETALELQQSLVKSKESDELKAFQKWQQEEG